MLEEDINVEITELPKVTLTTPKENHDFKKVTPNKDNIFVP
jgi:hypothetical protein